MPFCSGHYTTELKQSFLAIFKYKSSDVYMQTAAMKDCLHLPLTETLWELFFITHIAAMCTYPVQPVCTLHLHIPVYINMY